MKIGHLLIDAESLGGWYARTNAHALISFGVASGDINLKFHSTMPENIHFLAGSSNTHFLF